MFQTKNMDDGDFNSDAVLANSADKLGAQGGCGMYMHPTPQTDVLLWMHNVYIGMLHARYQLEQSSQLKVCVETHA